MFLPLISNAKLFQNSLDYILWFTVTEIHILHIQANKNANDNSVHNPAKTKLLDLV